MEFPLPNLDRPTTRDEKADIAERYGVTPVYRMSYNESPLGPSPKVVEAIQNEATMLGDYPAMGDERLRQALADTWGQGLSADHFYTGCSGYEALELAMRALLAPGDEVIVCPPMFGVYVKLAKLNRATAVRVPLTQPDFTPDIDAILDAVNERTKLVILCNPNNPTGTVMPANAMAALMARLPDPVTLIADEVYCHYVTTTDYPNTIRYIMQDRAIVSIQTFSKAYGLAGLRLGYAVAPPRLADYIGGLHRGFHQNRLALAAGIAALEDQAHLQKNVEMALNGRRWLYDQFDQLDLSYIKSETNFVVVRLPRDSADVAQKLLPFGVMVRPLDEPGLENCLRVTVQTPEANQQFITGLKEILENQPDT